MIETEPGNMVGPTRVGLEERLDGDPNTAWTNLVDPASGELLPGADPNSPRIVVIPITTDPSGGAANATVLAFAMFVIEGAAGDWNDGVVTGVFVKEVIVGEFGPQDGNPITSAILKFWS